jgi:hypothetical protein
MEAWTRFGSQQQAGEVWSETSSEIMIRQAAGRCFMQLGVSNAARRARQRPPGLVATTDRSAASIYSPERPGKKTARCRSAPDHSQGTAASGSGFLARNVAALTGFSAV